MTLSILKINSQGKVCSIDITDPSVMPDFNQVTLRESVDLTVPQQEPIAQFAKYAHPTSMMQPQDNSSQSAHKKDNKMTLQEPNSNSGITAAEQEAFEKRHVEIERIEQRQKNKRAVTEQINSAKHPLIVIAASHAHHYGMRSSHIQRAFKNCAFVFENDSAAKAFYNAFDDKGTQHYLEKQKIGVFDLTSEVDVSDDIDEEKARELNAHDPAFTNSDCIVVLGDLYSFHKDEFNQMARDGQKVIFNDFQNTPVDVDAIAELRTEDRPFPPYARMYKIGMVK